MRSASSRNSSLFGIKWAHRRLRLVLIFLFVGLAAPLGGLLYLSWARIVDESFLRERFHAEQTALEAEEEIAAVLSEEEARPSDHYSFFTSTVSELDRVNTLQRSPLSNLDPQTRMPDIAVIGFFQIGPDGTISSPALPEGWSESNPLVPFEERERNRRLGTLKRVKEVLALVPSGSRAAAGGDRDSASLAGAASSSGSIPGKALGLSEQIIEQSRSQNVQLSQDRLLKNLDGLYDNRRAEQFRQQMVGVSSDTAGAVYENIGGASQGVSPRGKTARKEVGSVVTLDRQVAPGPKPRIVSFEAEVDPLQVLALQQDYLVFFRKVWRGEGRLIQGIIVDMRHFIRHFYQKALAKSLISPTATLMISFGDSPIFRFRRPEFNFKEESLYTQRAGQGVSSEYRPRVLLSESLLYKSILPAPLDGFQAFFSVTEVPLSEGASLILILGAILSSVLVVGLFMLYRLGHEQISLAQKRGDFVSAVSHELKTPLTSIRMYGEMLKNGWVTDEEKKRSYYEYIFQECERLSRLISNVMRISRISNGQDDLQIHELQPASCLRALEGKVKDLVAGAGFSLRVSVDEELTDAPDRLIRLDDDAMAQICINLVDNAIKFARDAERKEIEMGFRSEGGGERAVFYVRDFGPGVPKGEQKKIFRLFYRSESELTRKTAGTGIGLSLVHELASRMRARADYRSREPGAEFQIAFETVRKG